MDENDLIFAISLGLIDPKQPTKIFLWKKNVHFEMIKARSEKIAGNNQAICSWLRIQNKSAFLFLHLFLVFYQSLNKKQRNIGSV